MNRQTYEHMTIDELSISESGRKSLKESGFETVGELVEFLEQIYGGRAGTVGVSQAFLEHIDEVTSRLKIMRLWSDGSQ